jgi:hypothetical protein
MDGTAAGSDLRGIPKLKETSRGSEPETQPLTGGVIAKLTRRGCVIFFYNKQLNKLAATRCNDHYIIQVYIM